MAFLFVIPGPLREYAGGRDEVRVDGDAATLRDALALLWADCPGARDRVLNERGEVRAHVNVFVDGDNIRHAGGLDAPVANGAEIVIVPAVSGGSVPPNQPPLKLRRSAEALAKAEGGSYKDVNRCEWARSPLMIDYHDQEWGVPVHDDVRFFEFLTLEGAQAGLSWETILRKRDAYREAFAGFDPVRVARFTPARIEKLLTNDGIVRNRLKIESTVRNAKSFLAVQKECGSFDAYVWRFVDGRPLVTRRTSLKEVPARTDESDALSRDLKKRGFNFVGSTICYAFMQATGLVNDHVAGCFRYDERR